MKTALKTFHAPYAPKQKSTCRAVSFVRGVMWIALLSVLSTLPTAPKAFAQSPQPTPQRQESTHNSAMIVANGTPLENCVALTQRGDQSIARKDYSVAVKVLEDEVAECPEQANTRLKLARAQMLSGKFTAADTSIAVLLKNGANDTATLITAGELAYLQNKDAEAEQFFKTAALSSPDSAEPPYLLGRLYLQEHNLQAARREFASALAIDGSWYKAYDGIGLSYVAEGNTQQAIRAYMQGMKILHERFTPDGSVLYVNLATLLLKLGSYQEAFDVAADAAAKRPGFAESFLVAGQALQNAGALTRAILWLKQSATLDPKLPTPHYYLAQIYRRLGQPGASDEESRCFKTLAAQAPTIQR